MINQYPTPVNRKLFASVRALTLASCLLVPVAAFAEIDQAAEDQDLRELADPTILKSRVWLDLEQNEFENNARNGKATFGALWAWRASANQDFAINMRVPTAYSHFAPADSHGGLGDIEAAGETAVRLAPNARAGGGLELRADTATDRSLGDGVWRLKPFASFAWDVTPWVTLGLIGEYGKSIEERTGIVPQHYCEFFLPATFILPDDSCK